MTIYAPSSTATNITVLSMWERLLPRLDLSRQSVSFINSCQEVVELITDRLWFRKSDLLLDDIQSSLVITNETINLPDTFLAIASSPFLIDTDSNVTLLTNIHESKRYDHTLDTGPPMFYELRAAEVQLFPKCDASYTLQIPSYVRPATLSVMTDYLPYGGLFNQLIGDSAVKISNVGLSILSDGTFVASLQEKVDKMMNLRNDKTIYWKQTRTGNQSRYNNTNSSAYYF